MSQEVIFHSPLEDLIKIPEIFNPIIDVVYFPT